MDKFGSVNDRMDMNLGSKFSFSLRIKTQLLKSLQRVIVVDGAIDSQKDGAESNGGSLRLEQRPLFCSCTALSWFCGRVSSQYLILDEVIVTLKNAEIFGSVLSGEGGSANGWRCC